MLFLLHPCILFAQTIGEYRSAKNGNWQDATSWEQLESLPGNWVPATAPPGTSTPSVTILAGDTVTAVQASGANNLTIQSTGSLVIFIPTADPFQLNGDNVNYGDITWKNGVIRFFASDGSVTITNHGLVHIDDLAGNANIISVGTFVNAPDGIFRTSTTFGIIINSKFINQGLFEGAGSITFNNSFTNSGIISPAGSNVAGSLRIESAGAILQPGTVLDMDILDGSGEGVGSDLLFFNTDRPFTFNNAVLNVNDHSTAPVMKYVLIRTNDYSNNFSGPFSSFNVPQSYSAPHIDPTNVWIDKMVTTLPLKWGVFSGAPNNRGIRLYWTTLQESQTAYFDIERSSDGIVFMPIGRVIARGNTSVTTSYDFIDNEKLSSRKYYYRLKQVDADGGYTHSKIISAERKQLDDQVRILNNAVVNNMTIMVATNVKAVVVDMNGRILMTRQLEPGLQQLNLSNYSKGVYNIAFSSASGELTVKRVVKL
jgi:hypothetical protein